MRKKQPIATAKIQRYYRPLTLAFILVSCVIVAVIVYFSFSTTIISVTAKTKPVVLTASFSVSGSAPAETANTGTTDALTGAILRHTQPLQKSFTDLTVQSSAPARAGGSVTIYNKYSKIQPLVAGTRLISDNNLLFRTIKRVDVPMGGSVDVEVIADQAGEEFEIAPSRFILPGLWAGLRDKIYGISTTAMAGGTTEAKVATINDIEKAKELARTEMYDRGLEALNTQLSKINADWTVLAVRKEVVSEDVSAEPDQVTNSIEVSASMNLLGVAFDESAAESRALEQASSQVSANELFTRTADVPVTYAIERYDPSTNTAVVNASVSGNTSVKLSDPMFERKNFINKDAQEIASYFSRFDAIASVEVRFSPFWVLRAPSLPDHIQVKLK